MVAIYRLPIIGDLISYLVYGLIITMQPLLAFVLGGYGLRFGSSIIWTPKSEKEAIGKGIKCLRKHDPEMLARFSKQRISIIYSYNVRSANNGGRIYGLHDRYIKLGSEGIATFIVASVLLSEASPSIERHRLKSYELAALKEAQRKVLEWMCKHSFHPSLIQSYSKVVEKWEKNRRFAVLQ